MKIEISYDQRLTGSKIIFYFETSKGTLFPHKIVCWIGRHRIIEAEYQ